MRSSPHHVIARWWPAHPAGKAWRMTMVLLVPALIHSQGFRPPQSSPTTAPTADQAPLLIGDRVPESLAVIDENGKPRTLLSYKSPLELLMVTFFSFPCESGQSQWPVFRRLTKRYT